MRPLTNNDLPTASDISYTSWNDSDLWMPISTPLLSIRMKTVKPGIIWIPRHG